MPKKTKIPALGLHARTGQARVLIAGRHIYLGKYGSTEAEEKYRRIVAEFRDTGGVLALLPRVSICLLGRLTVGDRTVECDPQSGLGYAVSILCNLPLLPQTGSDCVQRSDNGRHV